MQSVFSAASRRTTSTERWRKEGCGGALKMLCILANLLKYRRSYKPSPQMLTARAAVYTRPPLYQILDRSALYSKSLDPRCSEHHLPPPSDLGASVPAPAAPAK